jgi:predicted ATPase
VRYPPYRSVSSGIELALHAAAGQLPSFRDGAWLCELAPAVDEESMAQAVAAALRVRPRPGLSAAGSIVEFLRTRNALVVLGLLGPEDFDTCPEFS